MLVLCGIPFFIELTACYALAQTPAICLWKRVFSCSVGLQLKHCKANIINNNNNSRMMTTIDSDIASIPHTLKFRHSLSISLSYLRSLTDFTLKIWRHKSNAEMKRICLPATAAQPQAAAAEEQSQQSSWGSANNNGNSESSRMFHSHIVPARFQLPIGIEARATLTFSSRLKSIANGYAAHCSTQRKRYIEINFKLKERKRNRNNNNKLLSILPLSTWKLQFVLCAHTRTRTNVHTHIRTHT